MRIGTLALRYFRNYESLELRPWAGTNIILGENAQGKTNLLEAIALVAFGRSHRTAHDSELITYGQSAAYGDVRIDSDDFAQEDAAYYSARVSFALRMAEKKLFRIGGEPISRLAELMGELNVVLFSPESFMMVKAGASERRRFLNMEISQLGGSYFYILQRYNAVLKQRNATLKMPDIYRYPDYVSVWDEQLADCAVYITKTRAEFVEQLRTLAYELFSKLSSGRDTLEITYQPSLDIEESPDGMREAYMRALTESLDDDIKRGHTRLGIHRDELDLRVNGKDARIFASQGQQRSLALALKLSEIPLIESMRKERPVVLLDDVFSELDSRRCGELLRCVSNCQSFITCANSAAVDMFCGEAHVFECKNGTLSGPQLP